MADELLAEVERLMALPDALRDAALRQMPRENRDRIRHAPPRPPSASPPARQAPASPRPASAEQPRVGARTMSLRSWMGSGVDRLSRRLSDHAFDLLVDAYYYDNPGGGNLHIVLDEGGTSDGCLLLCLRYAMAEGDWIGMAIADEMLRMDVGDRFDYHSFVNARAERRRRGEPEAEEEVRFSLVAPPARKGVRG